MRSCLKMVPKPLHFLGQVDLSEAGDAADYVGLPHSGVLWFFHDADLYFPMQSSSWRVIYRDTPAEKLRERATPRPIHEFERTAVALRPGVALDSDARPEETHEPSERLYSAWIKLCAKIVTSAWAAVFAGRGPERSEVVSAAGLSDDSGSDREANVRTVEADRKNIGGIEMPAVPGERG